MALFQGTGELINVDAVLDTITQFHDLKNLPMIKKAQMDDDCERAMFRAFHVLVVLKEQRAISTELFGSYIL